jgi:hypothetical protein
MSKLLFERNAFQKLLDLFFKAKSNGSEDKYISKIKHKNPEVAAAFEDLNQQLLRNVLSAKRTLEKRGMDTTEIDDFVKQYYNKL